MKGITLIVSIFFGLIIILLIVSSFVAEARKDNNYEEIGLRISDGERMCYEFCDGGKYYFEPSEVGGILSFGRNSVCNCRD